MNTKKTLLTLVLTCIMVISLLTVPAMASSTMRASSLIVRHSCTAAATGDGEISVDFSITGKAVMSRIGAQSIYYYVQNGNSWILEGSYNQYTSGMSKTSAQKYANTIYYQGTPDVKYKVIVTLFVKDSSGTTDTRDYTFYVTA